MAATPKLKEQPYLGAWARSSFEQGALCALAAMSSEEAYFLALPGDAFFQCHGVSPCVARSPTAVLPLIVHYYGCKDNIHELHQISALPTLPQVLFGHRHLPPFWATRDWQPSSGIAVTMYGALGNIVPKNNMRVTIFLRLYMEVLLMVPSCVEDLDCAPGGPSYEVPPARSPAQDDDKADSHDMEHDPMEVDPEDDISVQSIDHLKDSSAPVHYYGTGLCGGSPADLPTDRTDVIIRLSGAYGPSLSQMFCSATLNGTDWRQISRATLKSHAE